MELPLEPPAELIPGLRKRRRWRYVVGVIAALVVVFAVLHWPSRTKIIISRETTRIDGPLNPDGTVNYVAALDAEMSDGITPENNAAVLLIQALGPEMFQEQVRAESLQRLGNPSLGDPNRRFVSWKRWLEARASPSGSQPGGSQKAKDWVERIELATTRPWSEASDPQMAEWLRHNAHALALVVEASRRERFYVPMVSGADPPNVLDAIMVAFGDMRSACRALAARAMLRLAEGNFRSAWGDVMALHRLARLVSQCPTLIGQLVAMAPENLAAESAVAIAADPKLPADQARAALADLQTLGPVTDVARCLDRGERFFVLDCVCMMARGMPLDQIQRDPSDRQPPKKAAANLDWNLMLRAFNHWYDRMVDCANRPSYPQRKQAFDDLENDIDALRGGFGPLRIIKLILLKLLGLPARAELTRIIGDLLISMLMPGTTHAMELQDRAIMRLELDKLAFALAAYKADKGAWPAALEDLRPDCLKDIPADRFTDKPLIYKPRPDGYILYSVGPNMTDDGGEEGANADDLAVKVPLRGEP
ncbi:MAG TPA: hypothetical protein VNA25_04795 [Phycisphaerae bacterium]|nr:hypothetical protein [Phycisphaerae bacterium]